MNKRNLTVYYNSGYSIGKSYSPTPKIILQGRWLERLGFSIGSKMVVTCEEGRLIIEKASTLPDAQENNTISMVAETEGDEIYGKVKNNTIQNLCFANGD